jgi:murein DD-endopeptidase MepM/ murein hydrolase activator NlpD
VRQRSFTKLFLVVFFVLLFAAVGAVSYLGWRQSVRGVQATATPPKTIGHRATMAIGLQAARGNVARAEVRILQAGRSAVILRHETPLGPRGELSVVIEAAAIGLREGDATLEVWARDDFWRPLRFEDRAIGSYPLKVDLTPPKVEILASTQYVSPGGAGLVAFRVTDAARADVRVGGQTFPSFALGPPEKGARVALVALAHDFAPGTPMAVAAEDEAGNAATRGIVAELKPRKFPRDTIEIRDAFLETKVPELLPQRAPSQPLIDGFLTINRDQRRQAEEEKRRIGTRTADTPLWEGAFIQPRNTKVFANFAETRTYVYRGQAIDTQVHFGYDLASTKQMPVPAANAGVVVFAGPLTIYGNTVVIDHGLGLQTLYAHLSSIDVKPGDTIQKGKELGRTGTTGLAIGDHLHYEVLVHGTSVTPLEWWDAKWIRDRLNKPLREAGLPEIAGVGSSGDDERPRPSASRSRNRRAR